MQIVLTSTLFQEVATSEAEGWQVIVPISREFAPAIATFAQEQGWQNIGFESMSVTYGFYEKLRRAGEHIFTLHAFEHSIIDALRQVKQPYELSLLKRAIAITDETFAHMCQWIQPGMTEREVQWEITRYMVALGADSPSFDSIVASGPNGSMPHAVPGERANPARRIDYN